MKFFRIISAFSIIGILLFSCKKENQNQWDVKLKTPIEKVKAIDISKVFYNEKTPFSEFKKEYNFFLSGNYDDAFYEKKRSSALEKQIYQQALKTNNLDKIQTELAQLFARVKQYFPKFKNPKVYVFSSATAMYEEPILYDNEKGVLFIDLSSFIGENYTNYKGIELYFQKTMNPQNLLPKVAQSIAYTIVPFERNQQKFIDEMVYNGKVMILKDAFLPDTPEYLKLNYTQKQYDWSMQNEANIWDFFVENDCLFSADTRLSERFIVQGPFSKFYTEVDRQSSPQVGIFTGWRICKKFFEEKSDTKLQDFLSMNANDIFNNSHYKPKN